MTNSVKVVEDALAAFETKHAARIDQLDAMVRDIAQDRAGWPAGEVSMGRSRKSMGRKAVESEQFKSLLNGNARNASISLDLEVKNTITGDVGSPAEPGDVFSPASRYSGIVPGSSRNLTIMDLLPVEQTDSNSVSCTKESVFTNAAAGQEYEGAAKPESSMTFTLVEKPVITLAHHISASRQVLADAPALARYIDTRLAYGLRVKLEQQLLAGDGTAGEFDGLMNAGNFTSYSPATGDSATDSIRKAIETLELADYAPEAVILHPSDWRAIELAKDTAGDHYLLGNGAASQYVGNGMMRNLWGVPVIVTPSMTSGSFLVGNFTAAAIFWDRQAVRVEAGFVNSQFTTNTLTLLAEMRAALTVNVPAALVSGSLSI